MSVRVSKYEELPEYLRNYQDKVNQKPICNAVIAKSDRVKAKEVLTTRSSGDSALKTQGVVLEKRHTTIKMPYPGCVITENHYLGRNGKASYIKPGAKEWAQDLIFLINRCGIKDWKLPLKITVSGVFKNDRERCDLHNLKILYDSIQKATGLNDKDYHTETIPGTIDKTVEPFILIKIEEI